MGQIDPLVLTVVHCEYVHIGGGWQEGELPEKEWKAIAATPAFR